MKIGSYHIAPPWWAILGIALSTLVLASLGIWQIERAQYKTQLVAEHEQAEKQGRQPLKITSEDIDTDQGARYGYHYYATGHYDDDQQILLQDQVHGTETGYRVWTPLVLASGVRVLVDRGWIKRSDNDTPDPDAPAGKVTIKGYWAHLPQPGIRFGQNKQCHLDGWPRALNYPSVATIDCQYDSPVAHGLLLLDPAEDGGFERDWDEDAIGLRPWVHYFYAVQWFFLASLVAVFLLFITARKGGTDANGQPEK